MSIAPLIFSIFFVLSSCSEHDHVFKVIETNRQHVTTSVLQNLSISLGPVNKADFLVVWGSNDFGPAEAFYLPVQNYIRGIGYVDHGNEIFDYSQNYGNAKLQGIIWMGTSWMDNKNLSGRRSPLGILAHETLHRWGAKSHYFDEKNNMISNQMNDSTFHWSFFLNTGSSPLGGNRWIKLSKNKYKAIPINEIKLSQIDRYFMGLSQPNKVSLLTLLTNVKTEDGKPFVKNASRPDDLNSSITVLADSVEISIDQIIRAQGRRCDENKSFDARKFKQSWIYLSDSSNKNRSHDLSVLEDLVKQWPNFYREITDGQSEVEIERL